MRYLNLLATVLFLAAPLAADAQTSAATLSVTGEGRVQTSPDMATISLGVTTEDESASAAMRANSEAVASVLARLAEAGIEPSDIQTSGLSMGPRYNYSRSSDQAPEITGYVVSNMVTVRIRALDSLGGVLDKAVSDGANTLNGLSFGLQDDQSATDEARRKAVADAVRKAALYAEAAGITLGRIVSIQEAGAQMPQPMPMMAEASFAKGADVPVASGELDIRASVTMIYEIAE